MKKVFLSLLACIVLCLGLAACATKLPEDVAGHYKMSAISGTVAGITVTTDSYEYFDLILEENGDATVRSKGAGVGGVAYEAKGTAVYEEGKIKLTTTNGAASVTEEYTYNEGVITYTVDTEGMSFTITFTKVTEAE